MRLETTPAGVAPIALKEAIAATPSGSCWNSAPFRWSSRYALRHTGYRLRPHSGSNIAAWLPDTEDPRNRKASKPLKQGEIRQGTCS